MTVLLNIDIRFNTELMGCVFSSCSRVSRVMAACVSFLSRRINWPFENICPKSNSHLPTIKSESNIRLNQIYSHTKGTMHSSFLCRGVPILWSPGHRGISEPSCITWSGQVVFTVCWNETPLICMGMNKREDNQTDKISGEVLESACQRAMVFRWGTLK